MAHLNNTGAVSKPKDSKSLPVYRHEVTFGNNTIYVLSTDQPQHLEYGYWTDDDVKPVGYLISQEQLTDLQPSDPEADWKANSKAPNPAGISKEGEQDD